VDVYKGSLNVYTRNTVCIFSPLLYNEFDSETVMVLPLKCICRWCLLMAQIPAC